MHSLDINCSKHLTNLLHCNNFNNTLSNSSSKPNEQLRRQRSSSGVSSKSNNVYSSNYCYRKRNYHQ